MRFGGKSSVAVSRSEARYRAAPYVLAGLCVDETFLLNKKTGKYYKLDDVGTEVWTLLRRPIRVNEILDALSAIYELPSDTLKDDLSDLLMQLVDYHMIEACY